MIFLYKKKRDNFVGGANQAFIRDYEWNEWKFHESVFFTLFL
jgi:hypothetical protein